MDEFRNAIGVDGHPAFAISMAYSSADQAFTSLDQLSCAEWLTANGFNSAPLLAHLRYCCRDDYGTEPKQVSAWAGMHYDFFARRGWTTDCDGDRELTWPEGNGRLVTLMAQRLGPQLHPGNSVFRATCEENGVVIDRFDHRQGRSIRTRAKAAILAMPHFVAARVAPLELSEGSYSYAPWGVANVTVNRLPRGRGTAVAWDNVSAASDSLGDVVATHQTSSSGNGRAC